eukprot:scaffold62_cov256-Pinguiococcus_pyrenoidosus.AAC.31
MARTSLATTLAIPTWPKPHAQRFLHDEHQHLHVRRVPGLGEVSGVQAAAHGAALPSEVSLLPLLGALLNCCEGLANSRRLGLAQGHHDVLVHGHVGGDIRVHHQKLQPLMTRHIVDSPDESGCIRPFCCPSKPRFPPFLLIETLGNLPVLQQCPCQAS